jgi:hypothetical protein
MTVRITGTPFEKIVPQVQEALDTALAGTLDLQQGALNEQPPVDTGRMASSWQIGRNGPPSPADRGENWDSGGKGIKWEYNGKITFKGDWYISNAVPYAQPVCLLGGYPPSWGGKEPTSIPKDWFTTIANQTETVFRRQFDKVKP